MDADADPDPDAEAEAEAEADADDARDTTPQHRTALLWSGSFGRWCGQSDLNCSQENTGL